MTKPFDHPLLALPKFGDGTGLHRVAFLIETLGLDVDAMEAKTIVVTGSNGKGSTAKICSVMMQATGGKVGLFTSPHLYRFNERFQINGEPIEDGDLSELMDEVAAAIERYRARAEDAVGAFEAQFVTALLYFQRNKVRWQVLEAGIGGRFDPVRMVRSPVVGLVSLDLEHTELLGRTLLEIAFDKIDAAPTGATVVIGETGMQFADELAPVLLQADQEPVYITEADYRDRGIAGDEQRFDLIGMGFDMSNIASPLIGRHQIHNHAVAARLCLERMQRSGMSAGSGTGNVWREALETVRWPGRLEQVSEDPPVYVDVGHTPDAIMAALTGYLHLRKAANTILVTGGSSDKDVGEMTSELAPRFSRIICVAANHKGLDAQEVMSLAQAANPAANVTAAASMEEAVETALAEAREAGKSVYVAGGLFLAAEFATVVRGGSLDDLRFF